MALIFPPLTFLFIFLLLQKKYNHLYCVRSALLFTCLIQGFLVFLSTEILSLFQAITANHILFFWIISFVLSSATLFILCNKNFPSFVRFILSPFINLRTYLKSQPLSLQEISLIVCMIALLILIGLTALIAPPNNWDSMTYHMPRVAHWIQNQTLGIYTTNIARQLAILPFAEYLILHWQILTGSDLFANFVQFLSMIGCLIGVSLICKLFNADRFTQLLSSVLCLTIPMGILQSSSTQNDIVSAFYGICFLSFMLLEKKEFKNKYLIPLIISLGLATFTKSSSFAYLLPFFLLFTFASFKKNKTKSFLPIILLLTTAILINAGHAFRCSKLDKSITDKTSYKLIKPGKFGIAPTLSNALKNIRVHLATPSLKINTFIENGIITIHKFLDIEVNDPDLTYSPDKKFYIKMPFHEDHAGNLLHTLLITVCLFLFIISKQNKSIKELNSYLTGLLLGFILFVTFCKWQPWISRLQLPLFIFSVPFIAIMLSRMKRNILLVLAILFVIASLPWVLKNESRNLIGRNNIFSLKRSSLYFKNRPPLEPSYVKTVSYLSENKINKIGILCSEDDWEYPLWPLLTESSLGRFRLEHVVLKEKTPIYPLGEFIPDAIITLRPKEETEITYLGKNFIKTRSFLETSVFLKANQMIIKENLLYQFQKLLKFTQESMNYQPSSDKTPEEIITFKRNYLNQAKTLSLQELQKVNPELESMIKNKLLPGLEIKLMGFAMGQQKKYLYGDKLVKEWLLWLSQNLNRINEDFAKYFDRRD